MFAVAADLRLELAERLGGNAGQHAIEMCDQAARVGTGFGGIVANGFEVGLLRFRIGIHGQQSFVGRDQRDIQRCDGFARGDGDPVDVIDAHQDSRGQRHEQREGCEGKGLFHKKAPSF